MLLRLLIVDDDATLCRNLKSFFERYKYKVETANDGAQALKVVDTFRPNLMFLDIGLPGKSGIEVLKEVKEKDASVRVVMITGQTEDELIRQARVLGADDYVTKPFTLDYLSGEVMDKLHKQLFVDLRATSTHLAIEREKVEVLFEQVAEGVILFDSNDLVFMANPVARKILGLSGEMVSLTASKIFENFAPSDPQAHPLAPLNQQTGEPFDLVREQPKKLVLNCRVNPIYSREKELFGYLLLFRDVTQERRAEDAMHRFHSMVSHKLRTPLVAIRGYPPLLLNAQAAHPLDEFQRGALQTILKECLRMENLVNQLIAFISLDPSELMRQPVVLSQLIQEAERILPEDLQNKSGQVKCDPALDRLQVNVDPTLMQHAFRNILENAFKFGATEIRVDGLAENGMVTVQFSDDGHGIPPEDRERIFERFYQVDKDFAGQVPGAGLGLSMVKETVQAHNGRVWVESNGKKGSTFFIKLPAANT